MASLLWLTAMPAGAEEGLLEDLRWRAAVEITHDDNLTRSRDDNRLGDNFATVTAGATLPVELSRHTRIVLNAGAGAERFRQYQGLDRNFVEGQAELQYRGSGQFGTPTYGLFLRGGADAFVSSDLRDGFRTAAGLTLRAPLTDRIFLFAAIAEQWRDGTSAVFDTRETALRAQIDYAFNDRHTAYFGLEARTGELVSVAPASLSLLDIADAVVVDDAFGDPNRLAYRFKANAGIVTLGYNVAFAEKVALDLRLRAAVARPVDEPPPGVYGETIEYRVHQATAALLLRF